MTRQVTACAAALIFFSLNPSALAAQAGMVPGGSYLNSCKDISYDAATHVLRAQCEFADGRYQPGHPLNTRTCAENSIWNDRGVLYCLTREPWGYGQAIPPGSYIQTCVDRKVVNKVLVATCSGLSGHPTTASLALDGCKWGGDISNDYGQLRCQSIIATHTPEATQGEPQPLVKPVAVDPAVVKPVTVAPATMPDGADDSTTPGEPSKRERKRRGRGERG